MADMAYGVLLRCYIFDFSRNIIITSLLLVSNNFVCSRIDRFLIILICSKTQKNQAKVWFART
jgi:hypothetical protein